LIKISDLNHEFD